MAIPLPGWFFALYARLTPAYLYAERASGGALTSPSTTVTAAGGRPAYTYAWTRISAAGSPAITCDSPTAATTTFSATTGAGGSRPIETWRCTVTDADTNTATCDVVVELYWNF